MTQESSDCCRFCGAGLRQTFCDLGFSPLSNAYIRPERKNHRESFYPLHTKVCGNCFLVQLPECESPTEIFNDDYAYFSSYSQSWLQHCQDYAAYMVERFRLNNQSQIVEIASNDGYLLQYFKQRDIPVLGIEPAESVAVVSRQKGITTLTKFFGTQTARELAAAGTRADLLLGNNVLAHVPDLNDFVGGLKVMLKPEGVITMEFPHLVRLMREIQFDTIYHEHFSYFSFRTVEQVFAHHGLTLFDVEELPTHGGSLRIFAQHTDSGKQPMHPHVAAMHQQEAEFGISNMETYTGFSEQVRETKRALLDFLIAAKRAGKTVVGYGAPAKGNTLMNYCGVRQDFIDYTVDRSEHKQGSYLPGTHIPIFAPEKITETKPDYVLILPWNIKQEIMQQMAFIREWGGKFVVPIPRVEVLD